MLQKYLLILFICLCNQVTYAQIVTDLYDAVVPLEGTTEAARDKALKQGLIQVLVKLSGDRKTPMKPMVQAKVVRVENYVQQFTHQNQPDTGKPLLLVSFDPEAVENLAQSVGLPLWSSTRPTFLGWIVLNTPEQQIIINPEERIHESDLLTTQATQRGLPILLPVLDLEDLKTLRIADDSSQEAIIQTASRYGAEAILVGRVSQLAGDKWTGEWRLYLNKTLEHSWDNPENSLEKILAEGVDSAIDAVAKRFLQTMPRDTIVLSGTPEEETTENAVAKPVKPQKRNNSEVFELQIMDVPDLSSYAKAHAYLQGLDIIRELQVLYIQPGQVTFRVSVAGGSAALAQAINLGRTLVPSPTAKAGEVIYRLVP